jgi:hypothetical protein
MFHKSDIQKCILCNFAHFTKFERFIIFNDVKFINKYYVYSLLQIKNKSFYNKIENCKLNNLKI